MPKVSNILIIAAGIIILALLLVYKPISAPGISVAFETVKKANSNYAELGINSGHTQRKNYVLTNQDEWREVWEKHDSINSPKSALPKIDFNKKQVIAVFQGQFPTGGYSIEINEIKEFENRVEVKIEESSPGDGCVVTQAFTAPFHIVKLKKLDKKIKFKVDSKVIQCSGY